MVPVLLVAATLMAVPAAPARELCVTRSTELLSALEKGDFAGATAHFDERVRAALDADTLRKVWHEVLPAQLGAFQRASRPAVSAAAVEIPLQFAHGRLSLHVACGPDGQVSQLRFAPVAPPARPSLRDEHPLAVPSPLGPLPGTLTRPAGEGPFPAILLVAGSGPSDRDETIGPNKPFLDLAQGLAAAGIASYRYDKRTLTYGAKMVDQPLTVDDEVTTDAVAALELLARQPRVDPRRVFLLGHSLGALMAPRIAQRVPSLAGVVMMAAPTSLDLDVVLRQTRYVLGLRGMSRAQIDAAVAPIEVARDAMARANPAHPPPGTFFHAPATYWLSLRGVHPIAAAKRLSEPMLIMQGRGDYQVSPTLDFAKWSSAFAHCRRVTLKLYPGLSHLFMPSGTTPSPADYAKAGHVDGKVISDLVAWIVAVPQPAHR